MKSGTSYLQDVLDRNRAALVDEGIDYLGRGTRAVWDILELREWKATDVSGAWTRLARQTNLSSAPARLLSMELLSMAEPAAIREMVSSLGQVRVIVTARDLVRTIPSAWQNVVKHGSTKTFEEFVHALVDTRQSRTKERFWRQHELGTIVRNWASVVGYDNVHIVTVPPSGAAPTLLWERFCSVVGADPERYDATARQTSNSSLSYSDAELLRTINDRLAGGLSNEAYNRYVRSFLANEVMRPAPGAADARDASRPDGTTSPDGTSGPGAAESPDGTTGPVSEEPPGAPAPVLVRRSDAPTLGADGHAWAVKHAERIVAELRESGVRVVGDLDELIPPQFQGDPDVGPKKPPLVQYPETAVRAMAHLIRKMAEVDPDLTGDIDNSPRRNPERAAKRAQRQKGITKAAAGRRAPGRRA